MDELMRQEFECWASDDWKYPNAVDRNGAKYILAATNIFWLPWQAAWHKSAELSKEKR